MTLTSLNLAEGKHVCVRRPPVSSQSKGSTTWFCLWIWCSLLVIGHVHGLPDLLQLRHKFTDNELETVNSKKIIVVPDELCDLSSYEDQPPNALPTHKCTVIDPDFVKLAF